MIGQSPSESGAKANGELPNRTSSPPAITLPKGGGAIRGMGEKFAANPVTGTGSMTVPITTSPGRSGFGPQLGLSKQDGDGNWFSCNLSNQFSQNHHRTGYKPTVLPEGCFSTI